MYATSDTVRKAQHLDFVQGTHLLTDPILLAASFYAFVERLAADRGSDPDRPRHLKKVTETV